MTLREYLKKVLSGSRNYSDTKFQKKKDVNLKTEEKTIVNAINELSSKYINLSNVITKLKTDTTLSKTGSAADAKVVGDEISQLKEAIENLPSGGGSGLSTTAKNLLITVIRNGVYSSDQSENITNLETALGVEVVAYSITNNLTNATNSNTETSINEGYPYSANISAETGYILSSVVVTMGGTDITSEVYSGGVINIPSVSGDIVINAIATISETTMYSITNTFTNVSTDNPSTSVEENGGYVANLTPTDGYLLETVTVTMGGVDITSSAYANGVVTISSVTGNVVITAIASEVQSEEVVFLEYLGTDGEAYINTEYVPSSINEKILLGVKYYDPTEYTIGLGTAFFGTNNVFGSTMWNLNIYYPVESDHEDFARRIGYQYANLKNNVNTGQAKYDDSPSDRDFVKAPKYLYLSNGLQKIYSDEEMTTQPTAGTFHTLSRTETISLLDENHPLTECYLGALNNVYENRVDPCPIIIYCLKVWDSDDNLIIDMKPARQGATIGMYDNVRQKFFSNASSNGSFIYGEVTE